MAIHWPRLLRWISYHPWPAQRPISRTCRLGHRPSQRRRYPDGCDVRLLAATNRNLAEMVKEKKFREDLYYRLRVVELKMPPLRNRKEDILPLAKLFLDRFSKRYKKKITGFDHFFSDFLTRYQWSGNIRELQNVIESAVALTYDKKLTLLDVRDA